MQQLPESVVYFADPEELEKLRKVYLPYALDGLSVREFYRIYPQFEEYNPLLCSVVTERINPHEQWIDDYDDRSRSVSKFCEVVKQYARESYALRVANGRNSSQEIRYPRHYRLICEGLRSIASTENSLTQANKLVDQLIDNQTKLFKDLCETTIRFIEGFSELPRTFRDSSEFLPKNIRAQYFRPEDYPFEMDSQYGFIRLVLATLEHIPQAERTHKKYCQITLTHMKELTQSFEELQAHLKEKVTTYLSDLLNPAHYLRELYIQLGDNTQWDGVKVKLSNIDFTNNESRQKQLSGLIRRSRFYVALAFEQALQKKTYREFVGFSHNGDGVQDTEESYKKRFNSILKKSGITSRDTTKFLSLYLNQEGILYAPSFHTQVLQKSEHESTTFVLSERNRRRIVSLTPDQTNGSVTIRIEIFYDALPSLNEEPIEQFRKRDAVYSLTELIVKKEIVHSALTERGDDTTVRFNVELVRSQLEIYDPKVRQQFYANQLSSIFEKILQKQSLLTAEIYQVKRQLSSYLSQQPQQELKRKLLNATEVELCLLAWLDNAFVRYILNENALLKRIFVVSDALGFLEYLYQRLAYMYNPDTDLNLLDLYLQKFEEIKYCLSLIENEDWKAVGNRMADSRQRDLMMVAMQTIKSKAVILSAWQDRKIRYALDGETLCRFALVDEEIALRVLKQSVFGPLRVAVVRAVTKNSDYSHQSLRLSGPELCMVVTRYPALWHTAFAKNPTASFSRLGRRNRDSLTEQALERLLLDNHDESSRAQAAASIRSDPELWRKFYVLTYSASTTGHHLEVLRTAGFTYEHMADSHTSPLFRRVVEGELAADDSQIYQFYNASFLTMAIDKLRNAMSRIWRGEFLFPKRNHAKKIVLKALIDALYVRHLELCSILDSQGQRMLDLSVSQQNNMMRFLCSNDLLLSELLINSAFKSWVANRENREIVHFIISRIKNRCRKSKYITLDHVVFSYELLSTREKNRVIDDQSEVRFIIDMLIQHPKFYEILVIIGFSNKNNTVAFLQYATPQQVVALLVRNQFHRTVLTQKLQRLPPNGVSQQENGLNESQKRFLAVCKQGHEFYEKLPDVVAQNELLLKKFRVVKQPALALQDRTPTTPAILDAQLAVLVRLNPKLLRMLAEKSICNEKQLTSVIGSITSFVDENVLAGLISGIEMFARRPLTLEPTHMSEESDNIEAVPYLVRVSRDDKQKRHFFENLAELSTNHIEKMIENVISLDMYRDDLTCILDGYILAAMSEEVIRNQIFSSKKLRTYLMTYGTLSILALLVICCSSDTGHSLDANTNCRLFFDRLIRDETGIHVLCALHRIFINIIPNYSNWLLTQISHNKIKDSDISFSLINSILDYGGFSSNDLVQMLCQFFYDDYWVTHVKPPAYNHFRSRLVNDLELRDKLFREKKLAANADNMAMMLCGEIKCFGNSTVVATELMQIDLLEYILMHARVELVAQLVGYLGEDIQRCVVALFIECSFVRERYEKNEELLHTIFTAASANDFSQIVSLSRTALHVVATDEYWKSYYLNKSSITDKVNLFIKIARLGVYEEFSNTLFLLLIKSFKFSDETELANRHPLSTLSIDDLINLVPVMLRYAFSFSVSSPQYRRIMTSFVRTRYFTQLMANASPRQLREFLTIAADPREIAFLFFKNPYMPRPDALIGYYLGVCTVEEFFAVLRLSNNELDDVRTKLMMDTLVKNAITPETAATYVPRLAAFMRDREFIRIFVRSLTTANLLRLTAVQNTNPNMAAHYSAIMRVLAKVFYHNPAYLSHLCVDLDVLKHLVTNQCELTEMICRYVSEQPDTFQSFVVKYHESRRDDLIAIFRAVVSKSGAVLYKTICTDPRRYNSAREFLYSPDVMPAWLNHLLAVPHASHLMELLECEISEPFLTRTTILDSEGMLNRIYLDKDVLFRFLLSDTFRYNYAKNPLLINLLSRVLTDYRFINRTVMHYTHHQLHLSKAEFPLPSKYHLYVFMLACSYARHYKKVVTKKDYTDAFRLNTNGISVVNFLWSDPGNYGRGRLVLNMSLPFTCADFYIDQMIDFHPNDLYEHIKLHLNFRELFLNRVLFRNDVLVYRSTGVAVDSDISWMQFLVLWVWKKEDMNTRILSNHIRTNILSTVYYDGEWKWRHNLRKPPEQYVDMIETVYALCDETERMHFDTDVKNWLEQRNTVQRVWNVIPTEVPEEEELAGVTSALSIDNTGV